MTGFSALRTTLVAVSLALLAGAAQADDGTAPVCDKVGQWLDPKSGETVAADRLFATLAESSVVLLGEVHDAIEQHRWQLHTLAGLYGRNSTMVVGFEMFPRRVQPALDRWIAGELDGEGFLEAAEWQEVWRMDPGLYMPLFRFARQNRVPMTAINVDRALVSRVRKEGWDAVPEDERAGLSDPVPASEAYRRYLAHVYAEKEAAESMAAGEMSMDLGARHGPEAIAAILESADFKRFVEAQLTWDRAMAEALAEAKRARPEALVVGIVGRGHIEFGYGIPRQLEALGVPKTAVLIPLDAVEPCDGIPEAFADAVFLIEPAQRIASAAPKPRLGVRIEDGDGGVRILDVLEGSVAETAGLAVGDVITRAAGFELDGAADLVAIVRRQSPGTWLPLILRREGDQREAVAKFPQAFGSTE